MVNCEPRTKNLQSLQSYPLLSSNLNCQRAWVEIDLNALAHNVRQIKELISPNTELMAVVKADAYGHGSVIVAKTALENGATWLAVATKEEGIELRKANINVPILLLGAINSPEEIIAIAEWNLQPTICDTEQALIFSKTLAKIKMDLPVHLKLDTGMSRLGVNWKNAVNLVELVSTLPYLEIKSIYSHLATADELDSSMMVLQHTRFKKAIAEIKERGFNIPLLHLSNSAGTLSDRDKDYDLVRVGLAIYGLYPAPHFSTVIDLKPVLQVKAKVTQVKTIPPGSGVSYGHKFISDRDTILAVVGIGYADGVVRNLSGKLKGIIFGQMVSQVGNITMDQLMLDVTDVDDVKPGDVVTLLGRDKGLSIGVDDWANILGTISWEIICGFKHRLPRVINIEH